MVRQQRKSETKQVNKEVAPSFYDYIFDWDSEIYVVCGGYGSSKSYNTALKIILKCFQEKRTVLVVREVFDTIYESCYSLLYEILDDMDMLEIGRGNRQIAKTKVVAHKSPLQFKFPNGSRIIFKGMDNPEKVKSINNVSIVWIEEASEVKAAGYNELLGRVRCPDLSMHFILTFNPVDKNNWVYRMFFKRVDSLGKEQIILDDEELYEKKVIRLGKTYYHHSIPEDNPYLPQSYLERLEDMKTYDIDLYRVAKLGKFGANGMRVLPQFEIAETNKEVYEKVRDLGARNIFTGMDFGFEESYNALVNVAVDKENKILYIYREYYKNHMTDMETANDEQFKKFKKYNIISDNEDPKAIKFYNNMGYRMRGAKKFAGSRLSYTKKVKRFKRIICAPCCINVIRELKNLTYKKDKQGNLVYDDFNIDPHTLSAIWYALDRVDIADPKEITTNTRKGSRY
nr:MAG TPA: terminase large subunit [Caudoviricetes sp.]